MIIALSITPLLTAAFCSAGSGGTHIVVERGWLATLSSISQVVISLLVVIMLVMITMMLLALKKSIEELTKLVKGAYEPVHAVIKEAREVTADVRRITQTVEAPVKRIVGTMDEASDRVRGAMERAEDRLERLDALAGIVQDQAEGFVVKSASIARGMRVGGAALTAALFARRNGKSKRRQRERAVSAREARNDVEGSTRRSAIDGGESGPRIRARTLPAP